MIKKICVFGSNKDTAQKQDIIKLGRLLAEKGFTVISGGFGGTMEDISKGAKSAGGKTIGVTYYKSEDEGRKKANPYIDEEIETKDVFERIDTMMRLADAFIVLPGETGTLLELAAVLEHIYKGLMQPKPIIAFGDYWKSVIDGLNNEAIRKTVTFVSSIDDIIGAFAKTAAWL